MKYALIVILFLTSCQQSEVSFTRDETQWLKHHGLYERAITSSDEAKLRIKEVLAVELSLINELDSLAREMNESIDDSVGIEVIFNSPLSPH